jgi:hypothetical protein
MNVLVKGALVAAFVAVLPAIVEAQQPTQKPTQQPAKRPARRQAAIEIRGQVPTPQVVTVRPREVPQYSRQVLVPNYYDHDFWQSLLPAYQFVPQRMITGSGVPRDSSRTSADSTANRSATGTPGTPTQTPAASRDTSRMSGTAPARPPQ